MTSRFITFVAVILALGMVGIGVWGMLAPASFAEFTAFPANDHFVHDIGAFQIGIGATLLLALYWKDALAVALAGFLIGNTLHVINHAGDLGLGGHARDIWLLALLSVLAAAALWLRLRQIRREVLG